MPKKEDGTKALKQKLASGALCGIYLFTGEEAYGRKAAVDLIRKQFEADGMSEFNIQIFEDKGQSVEAFREAVESFPVMADRKLVLIRNSGIFQSAGEEMKAFWQDLFKNPPEYLALVFDEEKTDGRSVLVKKVKESGLLVEFRYKTQAELAQWAGKEFAKAGLQVQNDVLSQLVFSCDEGMENLSNEIQKLISYCAGKKTVEATDVNLIVRKSLQSRIFEMLDAVVEKRKDAACRMLYELKVYRESPVKIIALIGRQAGLLLKTALLLQENRYQEVAKEIGVPPFIARKYVEQARGFSVAGIGEMLKSCLSADYSIKSGKVEEWTAMELLMSDLLNA